MVENHLHAIEVAAIPNSSSVKRLKKRINLLIKEEKELIPIEIIGFNL